MCKCSRTTPSTIWSLTTLMLYSWTRTFRIKNLRRLLTQQVSAVQGLRKWPRSRSIFLKESKIRRWGSQNVCSNRNSYFPAKNTPYAKNKSSRNLGNLTVTGLTLWVLTSCNDLFFTLWAIYICKNLNFQLFQLVCKTELVCKTGHEWDISES